MRCAVIADIHGNLQAFEAVLEDARANRAEEYLFLGDYQSDLSGGRPVAEKLLAMCARGGAQAVRGNREDYLVKFRHPSGGGEEEDYQSACLRWSYRQLPSPLLEGLLALPAELRLRRQGRELHLLHKPPGLLAGTLAENINPHSYREILGADSLLSQRTQALLGEDRALARRLEEAGEDILLFAHTHLQWHAFVGERLLLNPGSCGESLTGDSMAAYTLLDLEQGRVTVDERRVAYDVRGAIRSMEESGQYVSAPDWSDLVIGHLLTGRCHTHGFFLTLRKAAARAGYHGEPYPNRLFREAALDWREAFCREFPHLAACFPRRENLPGV